MKKSQLKKLIKEVIQEQRGGNDAMLNRIMATPPNRWPEQMKRPFRQWWKDNVEAFMDLMGSDISNIFDN